MVVKINSMGIYGIEAYAVCVETDISRGLPGFEIVGLPGIAVKESRDRVRSAIKNSGFTFPSQRITVNLAPANIKKAGALYDLPILVSILTSMGALTNTFDDAVFIGELSLSGELRPINGVLPMAIEAKNLGFKRIFIPFDNAAEGAVVDGIDVFPIKKVSELISVLRNQTSTEPYKTITRDTAQATFSYDFSDVKGQVLAKRALEIAAAGGHNILMIGSPGAGKSMLAKRVPSILPDMTFDEMIETSKIHSIAGTMPNGQSLITERPFRSPHHTVSPAGLSGGGTILRPGEISLAHNGVLFLDELPEFSRTAMEVLRQPLEDGKVTISRVSGSISYPSSVMLIAAMNPCPCGYFGHPTKPCICSRKAVNQYLSRVSGPLLDRLDIHIEVQPVKFDELSSNEKSESSATIRARVNHQRKLQLERFKGTSITCNARITTDKLHEFCPLDDTATAIMKRSFDAMGLSARAYDRILKIARTIADMDNSEVIKRDHIFEAIQFRNLDKKYWN